MRGASQRRGALVRKMFGRAVAVVTAIAIVGVAGVAHAQGIFLPFTGPVNQSMGGAAVAAPIDSAGALNWNPGAISGLRCSEALGSVGFILPSTRLASQAFGLSGTTTGEPGVTPIPTMSFVLKSNSPWTWGVGVYGVGGFSTNFPASSLANPGTANPILTPQPPVGVGVGRVFSHAEIYQIAPTLAYALTDKLSVGFAPTVDLAFVQADPFFLGGPGAALGTPYYEPGTGTRFVWGAGFQVGAYYIADSNWRFGASYKSEQWFESLRYNTNDQLGNPSFRQALFNLPPIVSLGASYAGFERWLYAVDVRYFDYNNTEGFSGFGYRADGSAIGLGWRSVWGVSTGLQYTVTERLIARAGYTFVDNPEPGAAVQFNVGTPLIIRHFVSVGGTFLIRSNVAAHIAYTHGFRESNTGPYVLPGVGVVPNTSITSTTAADAITAGLSVRF